MHPIADGSDLGGSLRNPASFCNVVGLRPTAGSVPAYPAANAWTTLSVDGALARSAADLALVMSAIVGEDRRSPLVGPADGRAFSSAIERDVAGIRVGWSSDLGGLVPVDSAVREVVAHAAQQFVELGAVVEEASPDFSGADEIFRVLRAHHFDVAYGRLLDEHRDLLKPSIVWNIEIGRALTALEITRAEQLRTALYYRFTAFFESYDLLLLPTSQVLPFDIDLEYPSEINGVAMGNYLEWMASCSFVSVTGLPACSVPAGFSSGLPVGVQLVGPPRADFFVLQMAHAFEQVERIGTQRPSLR
jgi:amidase